MKLVTTLISLAATALALPSPMPITKRSGWDYQSEKVQGVNLGGWFVLEPYITPSLFQAFGDNPPVDEYHYTQTLGKELALDRLSAHWSTWYVESDFENMASVGINMVRIPIGYWAFQLLDSDPYVQGQEYYLDQALSWCEKYNIKAWIDLHGVPGSQNGFDNSGLRDTVGWLTDDGNNLDVTYSVLDYVSEKYSGDDYSSTVIGIELVNEPLSTGSDVPVASLTTYYQNGYQTVRNYGDRPVIVHDGFQASNFWDDVLTVEQGAWDVIIDHHHYQVFSQGELAMTLDEHISTACNWGWATATEYHWSVAGEFSAALTDCAYWLNGIGRGSRWEAQYESSQYFGSCDGLNDPSQWTSDVIANYRRYLEAQLDAFEYNEKNAGWVFWCWKTESNIEWDMQRLLNLGVFPQPFSDRQYPNQCGYY